MLFSYNTFCIGIFHTFSLLPLSLHTYLVLCKYVTNPILSVLDFCGFCPLIFATCRFV